MIRLPLFVPLAFLAALSPAAESTFDADNEGWRTCNLDFGAGTAGADDFAPAVWTGATGVPAGSLVTGDVAGWTFYAAPPKFFGDQSSTLGGALSFDTFALQIDPVLYPAVVLTSGTTAVFAVRPGPGATWENASIPLLGAFWSFSPNAGGAAITNAQLSNVLSSLDGLYIQADWKTGNDTVGLDNVRVGAVPEPGSMVFLAAGVGALARRRRQSQPIRSSAVP